MFVKRFDVLLLVVLVTARLRIDTLADLAAPRPVELIRKVPWLNVLPEQAWSLLADWLTDPLSLLLISMTMGLVLVYVLVDLARAAPHPGAVVQDATPNFRVKLLLIFAIIGTTVIAQSSYLIALRHVTGPAAYTH